MSDPVDTNAVFDDALRSAVIATFSAHGLDLVPLPTTPSLSIDDRDAVAVIGFLGERVRGTLVIATSMALVSRTCPPTSDPNMKVRDRVRDWIGELSNLVLGKIKASLGRYGMGMGLSTPVAFTGEQLRIGAVQATRTRSSDFATADGAEVRVWLETVLEPGFELVLQPSEAGATVVPGEAILF